MTESLGIIRFGEVSPDLPSFDTSLDLVVNAVPRLRGYGPLKTTLPYTNNSLDGIAKGAYAARDVSEVPTTYAGDETKLYRVDSSTALWVDASRLVGGAYDSAVVRWAFTDFGQILIATNGLDDPQFITPIGGVNFDALTTLFRGRHVATVREFVVFNNTEDSTDGVVPNRTRWSGFNDPFDYTPSAVTQSDFQDQKSKGGVGTGIVGGEYGIVFQERSIWRMTYVGPPTVFEFDEVDPGIGTKAPASIVQHGQTFFLSEDGFRATIGDKSIPIGEEKIDRAVLSELSDSNFERVSGSVDLRNRLIYWAFPGAGSTAGRPNRLVIFNPVAERWSFGDEAVELLFQGSSPFTDLESLDVLYATLEDVPGSLDDQRWSGGGFEVGAIDTEGKAALFNGVNRPATFITGEGPVLDGGRKFFLAAIRPIVSPANGAAATSPIQIKVSARENLTDEQAFGPFRLQGNTGICGIRQTGRYFQMEMFVPFEFEDVIGFEPIGSEAGAR